MKLNSEIFPFRMPDGTTFGMSPFHHLFRRNAFLHDALKIQGAANAGGTTFPTRTQRFVNSRRRAFLSHFASRPHPYFTYSNSHAQHTTALFAFWQHNNLCVLVMKKRASQGR
jgi:hypothetical protein